MPWKAAWDSGNPIRPPPVAGVAQTASRRRSASAIAASQPPEASTSGPTTSAGRSAASSIRTSSETALGSATARPLTLRPVWWPTVASSTSTPQSSIGIETNVGPAGGSLAR